jgi:hypothetical protein
MINFYLKFIGFPGVYENPDFDEPEAFVGIKCSSTIARRRKPKGKEVECRVISLDCRSFHELDAHIKMLGKELKFIRKQGKAFFAREEKRAERRFQHH